MNEHENERRIVNWLGVIAMTAIVAAALLANAAAKATVGVDTAVIVALIGIAAAATSSLGTRRTRSNESAPPVAPPAQGATNSAPPPPYVPGVEVRP